MAWATQYSRHPLEDCVARGLRERAQVPVILSALNDCDVPATWATVGHLFLESCGRDTGGIAHADLPRVPHFDGHWRFTGGDWFQHDPCTDARRDPAWYAPDLIAAIRSSRTAHELGCHGFSHLGFGDYCPEEVSAAELDACVEVMRPFGVRPESLVFPGNEVGKFDLLERKGFTMVRAFPEEWPDLALPVHLQGGLWGTLGSVGIDTDAPDVHMERRLARLKRFVSAAARWKTCAHLWFHPSIAREQMERVLFPLITYCADERERGNVEILTMRDLRRLAEAP
jgi:peptidoglycan/xylan/chitin deacetylase (PgdA/CDA1 family)